MILPVGLVGAECIADSCRSPGTGSSDDGYDRNSKKLV